MSNLLSNATPSQRLVLLLVVIAGVTIRCWSIHESLWLDELHTAWVVSADGAELVSRAHLGNNSSVFFAFVKLFTDSFGLHEWTLRVVSLAAGCLLIPGTYLLCRDWECSASTSILAATLLAIDPNATFFATEARAYALVQLIALLHLFLFARLCTQPHRLWTWTFWIASGILLFHLHFTTALIFVAEFVAWFVMRFVCKRNVMHWIYLALGFTIIGLGMLPAIDVVRDVADHRDNWAMFIRQTGNLFATLTIYPLHVYVFVPLLTCLAARFVMKLRLATNVVEAETSETPKTFAPYIVLAATWIVVPVVLAWSLTELDVARLFIRRYVIASSIALTPLSALLISRFTDHKTKRARAIVLLVCVYALATISPLRNVGHGDDMLARVHEDWRAAVNVIRDVNSNVPVILYSSLIESDNWFDAERPERRAYCELPVRSIYNVADSQPVICLRRTLPVAIPPSVNVRSSDVAWLLVRGDEQKAAKIRSDVLASLGENWTSTSSSRHGRVQLFWLETVSE